HRRSLRGGRHARQAAGAAIGDVGCILATARPHAGDAAERVPDRVLPPHALLRAALPGLRPGLALGHGAHVHPLRPRGPDRAAAGHLGPARARDLVLQPALSPAGVRRSRGLRPLHPAQPARRMRTTRPTHAVELLSQLLLGETVTLLSRSRDGGWLRVRNEADGYAGWVRAWGVVEAS